MPLNAHEFAIKVILVDMLYFLRDFLFRSSTMRDIVFCLSTMSNLVFCASIT